MSEIHISNESPTSAKVAEPSEERRPRTYRASREVAHESPMGAPQDFLNNRFVYVVISPRARGLSVGVNMSPSKQCNFDCLYCEVNRQLPARDALLDVDVMVGELEQTIHFFQSRRLQEHPLYGSLPQELLQMRHVALSGHGEPTLCPNFVAAVQAVAHLRALGRVPFFKMVMITNGTGLDSPTVQSGLKFFASTDEIWVKLDAGTQHYMDLVNRSAVPLQKVLDNILALGRQRPVIIQSLFAAYAGQEPPPDEVMQYAMRLQELKAGGAQISMVQIYSATRPVHHAACGHLPLRTLSRIVQLVRAVTGLRVEVF